MKCKAGSKPDGIIVVAPLAGKLKPLAKGKKQDAAKGKASTKGKK